MILREAFDYEFSRLDPTGPHMDPPIVAVYDSLMVKGPDWRPRPGLAESWEVSPDGLEWRVKLRPGARFHSGAPADAEAVLRPLEHLRWGFPIGQLWYWDPVDTVRADGPETLVFTLRHPYARLPSLLWGTHTTIYNEALRAERSDDFGFRVADGTGPFRLVSWSPERVVAERSPDYHSGAARLDGIEWISILGEDARLEALERGEVHALHGPPLGEVDRLRADPHFEVVEFPQASSVYLGLDWRRTDLGFDDLRVRQAISLGVDREAIVEEAYAGRGAATWGPVGPTDEFYDPEVDRGRRPDPDGARAILAEARGGVPIVCECVCQDDVLLRRVGLELRDQLAPLGVHLELRFVKPFEPYYEACAGGPPSFVGKWLWQDALDAVIGFASTRCKGFPNFQHSSIPDLDEAFRDWLRAETRQELQATSSRAQRIAAEQLPYVPLLTPNDVWAHARSLHGWRPHPADLYPRYEEAWLDAAH